MKFSTSLAGVSFIASTALASPFGKQRTGSKPVTSQGPTNNTASTLSSPTWAGAVLETDGGVSSVTGTFTVPTPQLPDGGDSSQNYCTAIWVGIDGSSCQSAILQTGVTVCIQNGAQTYGAWYEWYPDGWTNWDSGTLSVNAGDQVRATVSATSTTSGTATVENLSNGQTGTYTWSGNTPGTLCQKEAEWIVEDFQTGGSSAPFSNFGSVTFTDNTAVINGANNGPDNADVWDMQSNGQNLATSSISNGQVIVNYG